MSKTRRAIAALLGTLTVTTALVIAASVAAPALREIAGPPAGFGVDVTSRDAYLQAVTAQASCTALALLLLGAVLERWMGLRHWSSAFWVANPISAGLGYWLFRQIPAAHWPYEYVAYHGWFVLSGLAPIILTPFVCMGARFRRSEM